MRRLGQSYWLAVLALAYVCFGAARSSGQALPWLALVALPLCLAEVYRRTLVIPGDDVHAAERRAAVRAAAFGAALLAAARTGESARPALDAAANLGTGAAAVGALVALARLPAAGGLLEPARSTRSLDAAMFVGFLWGIATAIPAAHALLPSDRLRFDPLVIDYATTSAGVGSLLVMVVATLRLRFVRRLELGIGDRARSAFALCVSAFTIAVPAAWLNVAPPDRLLPAAVVLAASASAWAATTREATLVTRLLRGLLAVTILGAPLLVAATLTAQLASQYAPAAVLVSGVLAILVGLLAQIVAKPLGPEQSRWLMALDQAARDALQPEPSSALRAALIALGRAGPLTEARPQIWQREPPEVISVDVAGYLHVERAEAPAGIYELGMWEPERTLRQDVLRALEVRRPEVRGVLGWMRARAAYSATLVVDEDGPLGFVLLPQAGRRAPLTLEEARAARLLADRVSSLLAVAAALSRSRERELSAVARADAIEDECRRLEHIIGGTAERHRAQSALAARPARAAAYSGAAQAALTELSRLGKTAPFSALIAAPGVDATAFAAELHLASARADGPFVVVDGASPSEQQRKRWEEDQRSPLGLADGGTLLVLGVTALPLETQETLAIALSRRGAHAPRSSVLPPGVVFALPAPALKLIAKGALSANLARWFEDTELVLPTLAERAEDLRALALDVVARACLALGREPLGLDALALRMILEHPWPENELELQARLGRAVALSQGPVLTGKDLVGSGLSADPPVEPELARTAEPARRRASRRPSSGRS